MADIFVSYKREDRAKADRVVQGLRAAGHSVFYDLRVGIGESWDDVIENALKEAKAVVVLWSPRSRDSDWVRNEAREGLARNILAPALIEPCKIPVEFSHKQAADLTDWRGDAGHEGWHRLLTGVAELLNAAAPQPPAPKAKWIAPALTAVVGLALAGGLIWAHPWTLFKHAASAEMSTPSAAAVVTTSAAPVPSVQPVSLTQEVRSQFWLNASWLEDHGECDSLRADLTSFSATFPGEHADLVASGMLHRCQYNRQSGARQSSATTQSVATTTTSTAATDGNFLASLHAQTTARLTRADFERAAAELNCDWEALAAVVRVQSKPDGGYAPDGRPFILFEPHIFSRLTNHQYDAAHPEISYGTFGTRPYPRTQDQRWAQLREAYALDPEAALKSASYGVFQILGQSHAVIGFSTARDFVADITRSEARQLAAFAAFVRNNNLLPALQARDWAAFARGYNGPAYAQNHYDTKMADAYNQIKATGSLEAPAPG